MLLSFLRSVFAGKRRADDALPAIRQQRIKRAHAAAPVARHLDIAFGDMRMEGAALLDWVRGSLAQSETLVDPLKALNRPLKSYFLARYFLHALRLDGEQAECGVFQGTSALLMCRAARAADPRFTGSRLHLVDSFAGISDPSAEDLISLPGERRAAVSPGTFAGALETVKKSLAEFPAVHFHRGWIPAVLGELPEARWAFVHIDVDLFEPTAACLEFFYPRLVDGGVIVCDDYGSAWFPGAFRAWDRFCDAHDVPFVVLDTGQAVILKQ